MSKTVILILAIFALWLVLGLYKRGKARQQAQKFKGGGGTF